MRLILLTFPLLLIGCGSRYADRVPADRPHLARCPHYAPTLVEWQHNHPYAKLQWRTGFAPHVNDGENDYFYEDFFPTHVNGVYEVEHRTYLVTVAADGKTVRNVAWGVQ